MFQRAALPLSLALGLLPGCSIRSMAVNKVGDAMAETGTNFAALALPVTFLADRLWPLSPEIWTPVAVAAVSLAATMELWRAVQSRAALRPFLLPGLALQRLTKREPRLEETQTALRATASVLRRELA